jgi:flagellar hook-associated protein 2
METSSTGSTAKIAVDDANGVLSGLGLDVSKTARGTNAELEIDGVSTISFSNSISFSEFTVDVSDLEDGKTVTVKSEQDVDSVYNMISEFVEDYNTLIASLNSTISEAREESTYGYYEPLTDDEKEEMSESDIEKWETAAKKGILYRDSLVSGFLTNIRQGIYNVSATNKSGNKVGVYSIGITTSSDYTENGKLVIDEDKLKEAITNDPDSVASIISGVADSMYESVNKYTHRTTGLLTQKAGIEGGVSEYDNTLRTQINDIKDKMSTELTRLQDKEDYYYELFSQMESSISNNNSTLDYLTSYFG